MRKYEREEEVEFLVWSFVAITEYLVREMLSRRVFLKPSMFKFRLMVDMKEYKFFDVILTIKGRGKNIVQRKD